MLCALKPSQALPRLSGLSPLFCFGSLVMATSYRLTLSSEDRADICSKQQQDSKTLVWVWKFLTVCPEKTTCADAHARAVAPAATLEATACNCCLLIV